MARGRRLETLRWRFGSFNEQQKLIGGHYPGGYRYTDGRRGILMPLSSFSKRLSHRIERRSAKTLLRAELADVLLRPAKGEALFSEAHGLGNGEFMLAASINGRGAVTIRTSHRRTIVLN